MRVIEKTSIPDADETSDAEGTMEAAAIGGEAA